MDSREIKESYYIGSISNDSSMKHYYTTNEFIFEEEAPRSVHRIQPKALKSLKVKSNPWNNWSESNPELITAKQTGLPINYLKTTRHSVINEVEDKNLIDLYDYVLDDFNSNTILTMNIISKWHKKLFSNIYPFAGRYRTVDMQKGAGAISMTWLLRFLDHIPEIDKLLKELSKSKNLTIDELALKISEFICEFLFIHPYREGNGRISRLVGDFFLVKNGFPPIGANLKVDNSTYIEKLHIGYNQKDYQPLSLLVVEKVKEAISFYEKRNTR